MSAGSLCLFTRRFHRWIHRPHVWLPSQRHSFMHGHTAGLVVVVFSALFSASFRRSSQEGGIRAHSHELFCCSVTKVTGRRLVRALLSTSSLSKRAQEHSCLQRRPSELSVSSTLYCEWSRRSRSHLSWTVVTDATAQCSGCCCCLHWLHSPFEC